MEDHPPLASSRTRPGARAYPAPDARLLLERIQALGEDRVALLRTIPVVHLAWLLGCRRPGADARRAVLDAARLRGITAGSPAYHLLCTCLDERPSEDFFTATLLELKALAAALPPTAQKATKHDIVAYLLFLDRASLDVRARRAIIGVRRASPRRGAERASGERPRKEVG